MNNVSCFICGGLHYAKDCLPGNWKAAHGYAAHIQEVDESAPENNGDSDYHSIGTPSGLESNPNYKDEIPNSEGSVANADKNPEGDQYDPDELIRYQFSSSSNLGPVYSQAT
jgi:hypothetical protein